MDQPLRKLRGKRVEIRANGFTYTGKLIEVTGDYVLLRRDHGFAQIELSSVQSIRPEGQNRKRSSVDSSFFEQAEAALAKDRAKKSESGS